MVGAKTRFADRRLLHQQRREVVEVRPHSTSATHRYLAFQRRRQAVNNRTLDTLRQRRRQPIPSIRRSVEVTCRLWANRQLAVNGDIAQLFWSNRLSARRTGAKSIRFRRFLTAEGSYRYPFLTPVRAVNQKRIDTELLQ